MQLLAGNRRVASALARGLAKSRWADLKADACIRRFLRAELSIVRTVRMMKIAVGC
jgi:hypothetical protein